MPEPRASAAAIERIVRSSRVRSSYLSAVLHLAALTALALVWLERPSRPARPLVIDLHDRLLPLPGPDAAVAADEPAVAIAAQPAGEPAAATPEEPAVAAPTPAEPADPPPQAALPVAPPDAGPAASADIAAAAAPGAAAVDPREAFAGRLPAAREGLLASRGGSEASEIAVARGLAWLALHQADDGSWRFDLSGCRCDGGCRDPGSVASTTAATGLALLPFLGAGHTHVDGHYREAVTRGLYYLLSRLQPTPRGGDLTEGTMYGHGVATLALAEALGMTRDDALARPLADAVRFIVTAQDLHGGGWRYLPGQAGDTTVTAWQFAGLKSAALAGVAVPSPTIDGVSRFLDRVQARDGEAYGYLAPANRPCTSAIGLFCRLHLGWANREAIERGLTTLARPGPAPDAIYRNFYLSQALLLAEHPAWPRWNTRNRDQLVALQARRGHEAGSWFVRDPDTAPGGRLAHTALAVLTLEVYYRLLPLYRPEALAAGW